MDLDWLKDFLALADMASFSRAADHRNVTQPAFSRRIRALEQWVGATLFVRGPQGATLTTAGAHFRPLAEDIARTLEKARSDTQAVGEHRAMSVSIAATHALSFAYFPSWIRRQIDLTAIGTLNLLSDSMAACEQIMLSGEVHFLLCHAHEKALPRFDQQRFESVRLDSDALIAVSAPGSKGKPKWPIPGGKAGPSRVLGYGPVSGLGRIIAASLPEVSNIETTFRSHLAATLLTMARQGEGVAWLPMTLAEDDLVAGRLVRAGSDAFDIPVDIRLYRSPLCRNPTADRLWSLVSGVDRAAQRR